MNFDYSKIPAGYYDKVYLESSNLRKFWHYQKFFYTKKLFPENYKKIMDIGCGPGSFFRFLNENNTQIESAIGLDISKEQINYAKSIMLPDNYEFEVLESFNNSIEFCQYDVITSLELIEHLKIIEIENLFNFTYSKLKVGGSFIISTPNYLSLWPLVEILLNKFSDLSYEDQHIYKLNRLNCHNKLKVIIKDKFVIENVSTSHFILPWFSHFFNKNCRNLLKTRFDNFIPLGCLLFIKLKKIPLPQLTNNNF